MADQATRDSAGSKRDAPEQRKARPERSGAAASEKPRQAEAYGGNPPDRDEDQNLHESGMYDIADAAQNQMPGRPQNVIIGRGRAPGAGAAEGPNEERPDKNRKR